MAALKAAMRDDRSSSRRSSRGRSRNRSQNGKCKGSKGPEVAPGPHRSGQKRKKINLTRGHPFAELHPPPTSGNVQTLDRPTGCDDTQGVSPVPQAASRSLQPDAVQGGGIRVHGEPSTDMGGRSQTQNGQSAQKVSTPGGQSPSYLGDPRQGWGNDISGLTDSTIRETIAALLEGSTLRDNLKAQMLAFKLTLPQETRPGVRVDQATPRLARAQKLKVKLEEKLFEVEAAVQDNLKEIAAATAELENAKRVLIPSAPTTDHGSACISFSREQSAGLHGFVLAFQKAWAAIQKERKEQNGDAPKAMRLPESPKRQRR